jgi:hypothetical protein
VTAFAGEGIDKDLFSNSGFSFLASVGISWIRQGGSEAFFRIFP